MLHHWPSQTKWAWQRPDWLCLIIIGVAFFLFLEISTTKKKQQRNVKDFMIFKLQDRKIRIIHI